MAEKIALGITTRALDQMSSFVDFLKNAEKYNHKIDHLIVGYDSHEDKRIVSELSKYTNVVSFQKGNYPFLNKEMRKLGLTEEEIEVLIGTPERKKYGKIPYGTARNYILLTALFLETDFLLFFDTDVFPKVLTEFSCENEFKFREVDFVGNHLKFLKENNDVVVTSSDYTGYYIIPKMNFPYLKDLLFGLQKDDRYFYISNVRRPVTRTSLLENIFETDKILGGNLALDLRKFDLLPPFFSTTLIVDDECYLGRGEDTLFGPIIRQYGGKCLDIDMLVFHNCFGDFPNEPKISLEKNRNRFFYACMGWVIRNPFFNWIRTDYFPKREKKDYHERLRALRKGSKAAADYFSDERFLKLPKAYKMAYEKLESDIEHFHKLLDTWNKLKHLLKIK
ncbi:MAG: hypothetical protein DRZ79_03350 [Candidatus Cloacimonadota bacterium]|nr:MAG: hypothetical protein DRZ79_03350 [Candidatus Cloacimonadota bacterium]